jgi:F0F1-type ATP synthase assembly protein I
MTGSPGGGDKWRGSEVAWAIIATLLAGVLAWGGIGWLVDRWTGSHLFLPIGVVVGFAGAFYLVIKRYGSN